MLVPVQIFGKVNPQELVAVHSTRSISILFTDTSSGLQSKLWTLASCAVENSINLVLRLFNKCETVRLRPEAHVVHSVCHCSLATVEVRHLAVAISRDYVSSAYW